MTKKQCVQCGNIYDDNRSLPVSNFVYPDEQICRTCAQTKLTEQLGN